MIPIGEMVGKINVWHQMTQMKHYVLGTGLELPSYRIFVNELSPEVTAKFDTPKRNFKILILIHLHTTTVLIEYFFNF